MDTHVKVGQVYLQPQKQGKKWKKLWLSLYPSSSRGVARLELQELGLGEHGSVLGPGGARRYQEKKVIRLADCVSVLRLPPHAEACPGDNMAAFCVETDSRRLVVAVEREECVEWVEKVCEIAFQRTGGVSAAQTPHMEENLIYVSREEVRDFWVSVQQTDAATRCGLQGAYWLQAASEELVLKEAETRKCLYAWPYRLLRRYGGDKLTFSIEAGRRCDSGPGTFTFDTRQGDQILSLIGTAIKDQRTAPGGTDGLLACDTLGPRRPRSPLPDLPVGAFVSDDAQKPVSSAAIGSEECVYSQPADAIDLGKSARSQPSDWIRSEEVVYSQPADCLKPKGTAPNSHMPLPLASLHSSPSLSPQSNPTEPVYMDPVHYISLNPPRHAAPALPSSCLPSSSSSSSSHTKDQSEPVYDEVYHRVQTHPNQKQVTTKDGRKEEPIYSEPCVGARSISTPGSVINEHVQEVPNVDPYAHLYAHVCKVKRNAPPSKSGDQSPEIIYENLGII